MVLLQQMGILFVYMMIGYVACKKEYPQIRERLWKEAFWRQSFCLLTAGGAPIDVIRSYISWESIPQLI